MIFKSGELKFLTPKCFLIIGQFTGDSKDVILQYKFKNRIIWQLQNGQLIQHIVKFLSK
jgi:hypothetical protein